MINKLINFFRASRQRQDPLKTGIEPREEGRLKESERLLEPTAASGNPEALCMGIKLCEAGNIKKAKRLLEPLAASGNAEAQYWMGVAMNREMTLKASTADFSFVGNMEDVKWWEKAAKQGHHKARTNLAGMYFAGGPGLPKDEKKAFSLYHESASGGDITAMMHVSSAYWLGRGVEKNMNEAKIWLQKAADLGSPDAARGLEAIKREMNG